jgi:hypothetical protein
MVQCDWGNVIAAQYNVDDCAHITVTNGVDLMFSILVVEKAATNACLRLKLRRLKHFVISILITILNILRFVLLCSSFFRLYVLNVASFSGLNYLVY